MMNLTEYREIAANNRYDESPATLFAGMSRLQDFANYQEADLDIKIHWTKVALCRNFSPLGTHEVLDDHTWLINQFLEEYDNDMIRPWDTSLIRTAILSVQSGEQSGYAVLGTTFLFGIIETYARFLLDDDGSHEHFVHHDHPLPPIGISNAINKLKKSKLLIGCILLEIDKLNVERLKRLGFSNDDMKQTRIADRLANARNSMLHGTDYNFHHGRYLCILYMLFHFYRQKTAPSTNT